MPSRRCPTCEQDCDSDFCPTCYVYLAWDLPPVPSATGQAPTVVIPAPATVRMQVQVADLDIEDPEALGALQLAAGSPLDLTAHVRNEMGIVDELAVAVEGLPPDWVEVHPATLHLAPAGSREEVAGDVGIVIRPPRTSSTRPGRRPFAVTVSSGFPAAERSRVSATLTVEPFGELQMDAQPKVASRRRGARFACTVANLGNTQVAVSLLASDMAQACWFDLPPQTRLAPGAATRLMVGVRPMKRLWVGRPVDHHVQIQASALAAGVSAKAPPLIYRQRPWIPWWAPPLILLLLIAGAALYLALPREVTMPALIGAPSAFAAQQELSQAGLHGPSQVATLVLAKVAPGTVVGQAPQAGDRVPSSTPVTLQVASSPATTTIVPELNGLTPAQAEAALTRIHLKLGAVSPRLDPKARIASQLPPPGSLDAQGESVEIVLAPRTANVPNLRGRSVPEAEKQLSRAGLALGSVSPTPEPGAKVRSQLPTPGTQARRGAQVELFVAQRTVIVPNLHGMTLPQADTALRICGLRLGPLPPTAAPGQLVAVEVPGLGSHQEAGTAVTVIMGAKPTAAAGKAPAAPTPALPTPQECRRP